MRRRRGRVLHQSAVSRGWLALWLVWLGCLTAFTCFCFPLWEESQQAAAAASHQRRERSASVLVVVHKNRCFQINSRHLQLQPCVNKTSPRTLLVLCWSFERRLSVRVVRCQGPRCVAHIANITHYDKIRSCTGQTFSIRLHGRKIKAFCTAPPPALITIPPLMTVSIGAAVSPSLSVMWKQT